DGGEPGGRRDGRLVGRDRREEHVVLNESARAVNNRRNRNAGCTRRLGRTDLSNGHQSATALDSTRTTRSSASTWTTRTPKRRVSPTADIVTGIEPPRVPNTSWAPSIDDSTLGSAPSRSPSTRGGAPSPSPSKVTFGSDADSTPSLWTSPSAAPVTFGVTPENVPVAGVPDEAASTMMMPAAHDQFADRDTVRDVFPVAIGAFESHWAA